MSRHKRIDCSFCDHSYNKNDILYGCSIPKNHVFKGITTESCDDYAGNIKLITEIRNITEVGKGN